MRPFELRFDFEASRRAGSIALVEPGGPAWLAGLRQGQSIKGFSLHWDDESRPVVIQVEKDGVEQSIEFLPMGEAALVPQFVPLKIAE